MSCTYSNKTNDVRLCCCRRRSKQSYPFSLATTQFILTENSLCLSLVSSHHKNFLNWSSTSVNQCEVFILQKLICWEFTHQTDWAELIFIFITLLRSVIYFSLSNPLHWLREKDRALRHIWWFISKVLEF